MRGFMWDVTAFFIGFVCLFCSSLSAQVERGTMTTIAGNGNEGFSGDGDLAIFAGLAQPIGTAFDRFGNLYIADSKNHVIRKLERNGKISTFAGTGTAGASGDGGLAVFSSFNLPSGVFVDQNQNVYIADRFNHKIRRVSADGIITTVAGSGIAGFSGDGGPAVNARLFRPHDVFVNEEGILFIADTANHVIRRVNTDGIISTIAGQGGQFGFSGDGGLATLALLREPTGVFQDGFGNLLIVDSSNHVVRKRFPSGTIITVAGNREAGFSGDGIAVEQRLNQPMDVVSDRNGVLFITDTLNHRIRRVNSLGIMETVAGNGEAGQSGENIPADTASLNQPVALVLDSSNNLVFSDSLNHRIRKIGQPTNVGADAFTGGVGANVAIAVGQPFQLSGSAGGGDGSFVFLWEIASGPSTDISQFSDPTVANPRFTPNQSGTYILRFTVDDEVLSPAVDSLVVLALNNNPPNAVFVTDTLNDQLDLSGHEDFDPSSQRDLVIRWNFTSEIVDTSLVENVFVFVQVNHSGIFELLGETQDPNARFFEWSINNSENLESDFIDGPQFGEEYDFRIFFITGTGSPPFFGPFQNSGTIRFLNENDVPLPTPVPATPTLTPTLVPPLLTHTPTPIPVIPTHTQTNTPTASLPTHTSTSLPLPTQTPTSDIPVVPTPTPMPTTSTPTPRPTALPTSTPTEVVPTPTQPVPTNTPGQPTTTSTPVMPPTDTPTSIPVENTPTAEPPNPTATPTITPTPTRASPPTQTPVDSPTPSQTRTPTIPPTNTATATPTVPSGPASIRVEPDELTFQRGMIVPDSPQAKLRAKRSVDDRDWILYIKNDEHVPPPQQDATVRIHTMQQSPEKKHILLQFYELPDAEEKQRLAGQGVELLNYVPNHAYWAVTAQNAQGVSRSSIQPNIRWMAEAAELNRLSSLAQPERFPDSATLSDGSVIVYVTLFRDVDVREFQAAIEDLSGRIIEQPDNHLLRVQINPDRLRALASLDAVEWVEPDRPEYQINNLDAANLIGVDDLQAFPLSLTGKGISVGVWDAGSVFPHRDFGSRLSNRESAPRVINDSHATHVAGTIAGSGDGFPQAKGMAGSALIHSYDWNNDHNEMRAAFQQGVRLTNHSYGLVLDSAPQLYGVYNSYSIPWDEVVFDTGLVVFKAAGNDGNFRPFDTIGPMGAAKNIITIGAVNDSGGITSFSSKGPMDDGRIKPDLTANGFTLLSTLPGNQYGQFSGTSMATPGACGAAALLYQYFLQITDNEPAPQLMKALMIHAARDAGNPGPDYTYGFGLIDAPRTAELIQNTLYRNDRIEANTFIPYQVVVGENQSELKATLAWIDPAGSAFASKAMVNDLDLIVKSPVGETFLPYVLNKNSPGNPASTGTNSVDTVEQVLVNNPMPGSWTIEVHGSTIPQGPVDYSIVSEGFQASDSTRAFDIFNDGSGGLAVDGFTVVDADWITVSADTASFIAPNTSRKASVSVNFDRAPQGDSFTDVMIASNDIDRPTVVVRVHVVENELPTATPTHTHTPTATPTLTATPTHTSTSTPTATSTPVFTATSTPTPTFTNVPPPNPSPTSTQAEPTPTSTPMPASPTPTADLPTPTFTQTPTPTATGTPTVTSTPVTKVVYGFDSELESLEALDFLVNPADTAAAINLNLPTDEEQPQATNGRGLTVTVPAGVFVTINAPTMDINGDDPVEVSAWFNASNGQVQAAFGGFVEIRNAGGANVFTLKSSPEFRAGVWHEAQIQSLGGIRRITPFIILINDGGSDASVSIDHFTIDTQPDHEPRQEIEVEWIPNLFVDPDESGIAVRQGNHTLLLNKTEKERLTHFVAPFAQSVFPNRLTIEMEVEKDEGRTGTFSVVLTNGPSSTQMNIPLFILPESDTHFIQLNGMNTTADIGLMHAVVQIAGDDEERVILNNVKVYEDPVR